MVRARRLVVLFVVMLSVSLQVGVAFGKPATWKSVDVTLQTENQQPMLLVSGELPADVPLPAEAELSVPAGMQLQWIGEILGGDTSNDPELQFTKVSQQGADVYRFTLTKSRTAQVEGVVPGVTSSDGTQYATGLKWTSLQAISEVRISQRIPQGSQIVRAADGASIQPGLTGYSFYTKSVPAKAGEVIDLSFSYEVPAAAPQSGGAAAGSASDGVALAVVLVVVVGVFGALLISLNRKMAAKRSASQETPAVARMESRLRTDAEEPVGSRGKSESQESTESQVEIVPAKKMRPIVPMLAVIGVFVLGFAIAGAKGTSASVIDGKISRNFGAASACQSASVPFTVNEGVDLSKEGDVLLKGFEGMEGVGEVTIDLAQSKIDIGWCESSQSEDSMRQVLAMSGLITLGDSLSSTESAPVAAALDADGKKQTASVETSSGSFAPTQLVLKAGVPAEIAFGTAVGCLSEVVIEGLGVKQDLTQGPATVKLPGLKAGTYPFACAMGHQSGQIIVE